MFIIKWIVRGIGIVVLLFIVLGVVSFLNRPVEPPSVKDAPWAIQTYSQDEQRIPSRIYYAVSIEYTDNTPIIKDYWSFDGKKFIKQEGEKAFPPERYGDILIVRRSG